VSSVTLQDWVGMLEKNLVVHLLPGFHTNLNKRLIKSPRIYFMDVGLASRLQGWSEADPLLRSPQAGPLFETMVLAEIVKTKDHHLKDWELFYFRNKEGEEVDFIVRNRQGNILALDSKLAIQSVAPVGIPPALKKLFPEATSLGLVTFGGTKIAKLSPSCFQIPIAFLKDYLLEKLA
jgi:uncharacterized protein